MRSWVIPAAVIVAFEYAAALLIGSRVGFRFTIPFSDYLITYASLMTKVGLSTASTVRVPALSVAINPLRE